ncbi:hypothetical protein FRX31_019493, partial [Thalictrum thalictroides]
ASFNRYCKVGCVSSVYATLQNSGEEIMKEAVEHCTNACFSFGTKGSTTSALEVA